MTEQHSGVKSTGNRNYLSIFCSEKHNRFLRDCSITLIDKTNGSDPTRREEYWLVLLKTVAPYGLNRIKKAY